MEWDAWYQGKTFTTDWTTHNFETWMQVLAPYRQQRVSVLEIGSWEGRSAIFFLEYLPFCFLTCVDSFEGGEEHSQGMVAQLESRFDSNLIEYADRVRKIKSRSGPALYALSAENSKFDIIYIDGSHQRDDVLIDSILAWQVLKTDGILIWDDYLWGESLPLSKKPQQAIDTFLGLHADDCVKLLVGQQVIVQKADAPSPTVAAS